MSTNNPRKKREAEKARAEAGMSNPLGRHAAASAPVAFSADSGELSRADDITIMVGKGGSDTPAASGSDDAAPNHAVAPTTADAAGTNNVGTQAKAAEAALQAKAAAAAAAAKSAGDQASKPIQSSGPLSGGLSAASAQSSPAPTSSEPADPAEAETVSFTSATELLNQTQQQMKKAKSEAARQKRAQEMEAAQKKARGRKIRRRILLAVIGVLIVAVLILALVFCAERWWLHDDEYDIQGTWQVEGTDATVTITEDNIVLTDEVAYRYDIDPYDKSISFNFGTLTGNGHYRFSLDRDRLSITDGTADDASGNLIEDIGWWVNASVSQLFGHELTPAIDGSALALERK